MSKHVAISPAEAADRLAIRELVEAYAHCADRRDAKGQMALFTADTHFVVYMNAKDPTPSQELHSREALAPVFAELNKYYGYPEISGYECASIAGLTYRAGEAGAQATEQSERIRPWFVANRFQAISQASMMSARLRNTELASQWLRR